MSSMFSLSCLKQMSAGASSDAALVQQRAGETQVVLWEQRPQGKNNPPLWCEGVLGGVREKSNQKAAVVKLAPDLYWECIYSILLPVLWRNQFFCLEIRKSPKSQRVLGFVFCFSQHPLSIPQENCMALLAELKRREGSDVLCCSPHI